MPETHDHSEDLTLLEYAIREITDSAASTPRPPQATLSGWITETFDPENDQRHLAARAPTGTGKALDVDTPIPAPSGWKRMGDLTAGDEVFDENGNICHVVVAHPVQYNRQCYELTFDDGSTIIADVEHLWPSLTRKLRQQRSEARRRPTRSRTLEDLPLWETLTTQQMADTMLGQGDALNHAVPVSAPIEGRSGELAVDPYTLGAWLGDGDSNGGGFTNPDEHIIRRIRERGYVVKKLKAPYKWSIHLEDGPVNNRWDDCFPKKLDEIGVRGDKHIPTSYLRAGFDDRLELLRGLMDSDGYVDARGLMELTLTRENLVNGALELLHTFGIKGRIRASEAAITERDDDGNKVRRTVGTRWRIHFTTTLPIFTLPRKAERIPDSNRETCNFHYVRSIRPVETRPVRCIGVDSPSHLFLAGESMIPTHNSLSYLAPAFENAVAGKRTLISTEGLGLQRQIIAKDAPAVAKAAYEKHGVDVRTAVLKGFSNYVCANKAGTSARKLLDTKGSMGGADLAKAIEAENRTASEVVQLGHVTSTWGTLSALFIWALRDGDSLDRDDCPVELPGAEWSLVSVSAQEHSSKTCPDPELCPASASRLRAAESQIVVTNHTMLAIQAAKKIPVVIGNESLGEFHQIVVDEAHALPGIVRSQGSVEITEARIERLAKRLSKEGSPARPPNWFITQVDEVRSAAGYAMKTIDNHIGKARVGEDIRLDEDDDFEELNAVRSGLGGLKDPIKKNRTVFDEGEANELVASIDSLISDIETANEHRTNVARWLVRDSQPKGGIAPKLCASPVDVGSDLYFNVWSTEGSGVDDELESLRAELENPDLDPLDRLQLIDDLNYARENSTAPRNELSVAAVSATLSPSFPHETGLKAKIRDVPTPFDEAYAGSAVFTPMPLDEDIAEIGDERWGKVKLNTQAHAEWCVEVISELLYANSGSGMVISATAGAGRRYAEALRADSSLAFNVYSQWDARGKAATIELWKQDTNSVIVGTKSLMTGVDAPGETNSIVIVDRPSRAPLNPVDKARCDMLIDEGENKFVADARVYVEDASVLLEQAIGRLIRSNEDRGMVAVLDPRLPNKSPMAYSDLVRKIYKKPLKPYGEKLFYLDHALDWLEERRAAQTSQGES